MVRLIADEGKVYTNGQTYGKEVYLPDNADQSVWSQIDEADILSISEATEADKDAALTVIVNKED